MAHKGLKIRSFLLLLLVTLDDFSHKLSQADRGIVSTGQHQSIQQILNIQQISSRQLCRSPWCFRYLIRHPIEAILEIYFVFLADEDGEVTGHYFAQGSYLYLLGFVEGSNWLILLYIVYIEDPSAEDLRVVLDFHRWILCYTFFYLSPVLYSILLICQKTLLEPFLHARLLLKLKHRTCLIQPRRRVIITILIIGRFFACFYFILKLRGAPFAIDLRNADPGFLLLFFLRVLTRPVDLCAIDGLQFHLFTPQNIALVSALEIYQINNRFILLFLPRWVPPSALTNLLDFDTRQPHQLCLPTRNVHIRNEEVVQAGPLRHQNDPFLSNERLEFLMRGYLFLQLLYGFVADGVEELFGGFYLFGGERHSQLLVAEDSDALEGAGGVQDWELVDFIVGKDGLQHYKINKREGTDWRQGGKEKMRRATELQYFQR